MQALRFALFAGLLAFASAYAAVTLTHVHGLAYSPDGKRLMIPSHHGLAVYENGKWTKAAGPQHDYMGFVATEKHLYCSGHPAPGSGMVNPFGLIRSRDGGKMWEKLGLEGETDFHLMAASWNANAIYVWNPAPSSRIREPGLHYTLDDGSSWKHGRARGLKGDPHALAVHPADPKIVAVGTRAASSSRATPASASSPSPKARKAFRSSSISTARIFGTAPSAASRVLRACGSASASRKPSRCRRSAATRSPTSRRTRRGEPNTRSRPSSAASTCPPTAGEAGR